MKAGQKSPRKRPWVTKLLVNKLLGIIITGHFTSCYYCSRYMTPFKLHITNRKVIHQQRPIGGTLSTCCKGNKH